MRVAVIDIGSNSIKLLVAEAGPGGAPVEVLSRTLEVRISAGIGGESPRLAEQSMERGAAAVLELADQARGLGAAPIEAVATSAVRDASNGALFCGRVVRSAGLAVRVLSGQEEASLIGRGLTTDPGLGGLGDFCVFDLGGGSLECLAFRRRALERTVSLPLGCVRLTEGLVGDPGKPLSPADAARVSSHVARCLASSGFPLPLAAGFAAVGTGGTLTTARAIEAARRGVPFAQSPSLVTVAALRALLGEVGSMDLAGRRAVPGLSPARADVYPVALATLVALADAGRFGAYLHSLRNLRWGIAAQLLAAPPTAAGTA